MHLKHGVHMTEDEPSAFDVAFRWILKAEGAETDDPEDPGGRTRYGISQSAHPDIDVPHLTERVARDLYLARYWDAYGLGRLPSAVSVAVFDAAVNQGPRPAVRMLQHALGVAMDGKLGPITIGAAYRADPIELLTNYCARRSVYYAHLGGFGRFGTGWMRRLFLLYAHCRSLAA